MTAYLATLLGWWPFPFRKPRHLLCSPCVHTQAFLRHFEPTPYLLWHDELTKRRKTQCSICGTELLNREESAA